MSKEERSLLELSIEVLEKSEGPLKIDEIIAKVMQMKGYKGQEAKDHAAQFVMDFMLSGNFVYCGEDNWDLKYRQPTSVLDKDGGDYEDFYYNEEVKNNELKDESYDEYEENQSVDTSDEDEDDDDDQNSDDTDDLSNEFEELVGDVEDLEEEDEDDEE